MRREAKNKNDDERWEKQARSCINEKIEYPIEAHNRHKFMGRSTFRNDNQTPTRASLIDRYDCLGKKELSSGHYPRFLLP